MRALSFASLLLLACTPPATSSAPTLADAASSPSSDDAGAALDASDAMDSAAVIKPSPRVSDDDAAEVLFGSTIPAGCSGEGDAKVACWIELRYRSDPDAKDLALALFRETGDVAGMGKDEIMDGGFRGKLHLVPELPMGRYRNHLQWVLDAARDFESFFQDLFRGEPSPRYRWHALTARFMRSVGRTTPSAYASPWTFSYNVSGSLLGSATGVRETLFHEFFHMNDEDHDDWSPKNLATDYAAILKKCGASVACLAPYAPGDTVVRGGTYYAFQQNNGVPVHEYGAELALRYYKEQREMLRDKRLSRPAFKCGPPENARSWSALVTEFFAGVDRTPKCAP